MIKKFGRKFLAISQAEVIIALVIMSLVILASKNITESKFNYAKRVRAYAAWNNLAKITSSAVSDGVLIEDTYNYKMISPVYKTTESGSYLPDILGVNDMPATHINGGFYDRLIEHFNVLESEAGPTFTCNNCNTAGYFNEDNVKPTLYLSNGMTLYISPTAYSFGMRDVDLTAIVNDNFKKDLKCLNGLPSSATGDADCNRFNEIGFFCSPIEAKAAPIAPWSTTYSGNIALYFRNIAECPSCANTGQAIRRYPAVPLLEYFHVLFKSIKVNPSCSAKSESFLNEAFTRYLAGSYYVVFVDSDGPRVGTNTLNDDVLEFYVLLNGEVLPISPKMRTGDFLLANLYSTTNAGVRSIISSGVALPRVMCHHKFANNVFSYFSTNFIPIRNYCPATGVECPANTTCDYIPLKATVSVRGRGKRD